MYQVIKSNHLSTKSILLILFSMFFISSCVEDDEADNSENSANQAAFLNNSAVIISHDYEVAKKTANDLASSIVNLKSDADQNSFTESDLTALKSKLKAAWKAWQNISLYDFGYAEQVGLRSNVNIYKTDTQTIENSIQTGNYNLEQLSFKTAKGFPAIDYLLNAKSVNETVNAFNTDSNRINYLVALANDLATRVETVEKAWTSNRSSFESNTGTDVGSSTGMLVNALNLHYEKYFRDNKLGIPLGVRSAGIPRPDFCEAVYGGYSVELANENFNAFKNFYSGITSDNNDGYGLDDYLNDADAVELNNRIVAQISLIDLKLSALNDPLPQKIQNNSQAVQDAYNEIQKLIVLLKVDLPSRIGVLITYQDNDGD